MANINKSKEENKNKKKTDYKKALIEKDSVNSVIKSINTKVESYNKSQFAKIKSEHEKLKEEEMKKQKLLEENKKSYYEKKKEIDLKKTQELKEQMAELEKLEEKCLQNLKTTQQKTNNLLRFGSSHQAKKENTARKLNFDKKTKTSSGIRSKSSAVRDVKKFNSENVEKAVTKRNHKSSLQKDNTTGQK